MALLVSVPGPGNCGGFAAAAVRILAKDRRSPSSRFAARNLVTKQVTAMSSNPILPTAETYTSSSLVSCCYPAALPTLVLASVTAFTIVTSVAYDSHIRFIGCFKA